MTNSDAVRSIERLRPMMSTERTDVFDDPRWSYSLQRDGYSVLAAVGRSGVRLQGRQGADLTPRYAEVVQSLSALPSGEHVLDGQICVLDPSGRSNFQCLSERARARQWSPGQSLVTLVVTDALLLCGVDVREWPFKERRALLHRLLVNQGPDLPRPLRFNHGFDGMGTWMMRQAWALSTRGIYARDLAAAYECDRASDGFLFMATRDLPQD